MHGEERSNAYITKLMFKLCSRAASSNSPRSSIGVSEEPPKRQALRRLPRAKTWQDVPHSKRIQRIANKTAVPVCPFGEGKPSAVNPNTHSKIQPCQMHAYVLHLANMQQNSHQCSCASFICRWHPDAASGSTHSASARKIAASAHMRARTSAVYPQHGATLQMVLPSIRGSLQDTRSR